MTALDQAFVKAYVQHGAAPAASWTHASLTPAAEVLPEPAAPSHAAAPASSDETPRRSPAPRSRKKASGRSGANTASPSHPTPVASATEAVVSGHPGGNAKKTAPRAGRASSRGGKKPAAGLPQAKRIKRTKSRLDPPTAASFPAKELLKNVGKNPRFSSAIEECFESTGTAPWAAPPTPMAASSAAAPVIAPKARPSAAPAPIVAPAALESPLPGSQTPVADNRVAATSAVTEIPAPTVEQALVDADLPEYDGFRPLLQVERLSWPEIVGRLAQEAGDALSHFTDELRHGVLGGCKVIALTGCRRGDGVTTLVLCLAHCLVERGLRVAVLDGDFEHPRLGRRLGLLPEAGWQQAIFGQMSLAEVTIESVEDRLMVLPWASPSASDRHKVPLPCRPVETLGELRESYDVILVDAGSSGQDSSSLLGSVSEQGWADAVVLIHHVRSVAQAEYLETCCRLQAGHEKIVVVENFA